MNAPGGIPRLRGDFAGNLQDATTRAVAAWEAGQVGHCGLALEELARLCDWGRRTLADDLLAETQEEARR